MATGALHNSFEWDRVDLSKSGSSRTVGAALSRIAADSRRSNFAILAEIISLRLGAGRLSLDEYLDSTKWPVRKFNSDQIVLTRSTLPETPTVYLLKSP